MTHLANLFDNQSNLFQRKFVRFAGVVFMVPLIILLVVLFVNVIIYMYYVLLKYSTFASSIVANSGHVRHF
jgi:hypothetical protein